MLYNQRINIIIICNSGAAKSDIAMLYGSASSMRLIRKTNVDIVCRSWRMGCKKFTHSKVLVSCKHPRREIEGKTQYISKNLLVKIIYF